ncbi:MAG: DUF1573 domain-containing protein [Verrucomicrobiota bacterium]
MMFSRFLGFVVTASLVLLAFSGFATAKDVPTIQSAFASTTVQIIAMPDAVNVPVEWIYTNHWNNPLMVEKFDESCGCLSGQAKLAETSAVEPGKTGVIHASFTAGQLRGFVRKSLYVRFVGHEKPVELILEAKIPKSVELSTPELVWKTSSIEAKTIDVTTGTSADFSITGLTGLSADLFEVSVETIAPKRHYRLTIKPKQASTIAQHTLLVSTDSKDKRDQMFAIFLSAQISAAEGSASATTR